jgi:hypothetical protein
MAIWYIIANLSYFLAIWNFCGNFGLFFSRFGLLHQEKSGNPA